MSLPQSLVCERIAALLAAAPALAGVPVYVQRTRAIGRDTQRAIVVRRGASRPASRGVIQGAPVDWETAIAVECCASAADSRAADAAADALLAAAHAVIAADPSLGGIADDVLPPQITWDADELDQSLACAIALYTVQHRTGPDLTA